MKRFGTLLVYTVLVFGPTFLFGQDHAATPNTQPQKSHKAQGFADYALGKVNPNNADYGASLDAARGTSVAQTIDDLYFWSNVVALILLTGLTTAFFFHLRAADKKEIIAATLIAQLWNGRVSDRAEIERRAEQFNNLVDEHNAVVERELTTNAPEADRETPPAANLNRTVGEITDAARPENRTAPRTSFEPVPPGAKEAVATGNEVVRLQQDNLLLEHRVEAMRNTEQNLKERLNQTTSLLDQERRRNQALKGA
jgi:hypothetical protein